MRTLLVNPPPFKIQEPFYDTPPYPRPSLAFLAAYLRRAGIQVEVLDCKFDRLDYSAAMEKISQLQPQVVGLTAYTNEIIQAAKQARLIKEWSPQTLTVIGGIHVTALPERTLREFPEFDYAVIGEGEETFLELIRSLGENQESRPVLGVARLDDTGVYHYAGDRPKIMDLDSLEIPAWDMFRPSQEYIVHTSRGCPFHCFFCMNPHGRKVRAASPKKVLDEVEMLVQLYHPATIAFGDEIFTVNRDRTMKICQGFIDRGIHHQLKWACQTHVRCLDEELVALMKEAGCTAIGLGIETGDLDKLKDLSKGSSEATIKKAVTALKKVQMPFHAFFILGMPNETYDSAMKTIKFAVALNPTIPIFGIMVPYPGTKINEMAAAGEGGYILQARDWNDFNKQIGDALALKHLSRRNLEILQLRGYLEVFLRNGRIRDLLKFFWQYRTLGLAVIGKGLERLFRQAGE